MISVLFSISPHSLPECQKFIKPFFRLKKRFLLKSAIPKKRESFSFLHLPLPEIFSNPKEWERLECIDRMRVRIEIFHWYSKTAIRNGIPAPDRNQRIPAIGSRSGILQYLIRKRMNVLIAAIHPNIGEFCHYQWAFPVSMSSPEKTEIRPDC